LRNHQTSGWLSLHSSTYVWGLICSIKWNKSTEANLSESVFAQISLTEEPADVFV